jgi:hypothetical protein
MSITNQPTTDLSSAEARKLNNKIKHGLYVTWVQIAEAYRGRIHLALGYPSWNDYLTEEFGGVRPLWVPRERRPNVVRALRQTGMSLRAIAATMGVTDHTVRRDLDESTAANPAVELPDTTNGLDGRNQPARRKPPTPTPPTSSRNTTARFRATTEKLLLTARAAELLSLHTTPGNDLDASMAALDQVAALVHKIKIAASQKRAA